LHVDQHAHRRIDSRDFFHGQHGFKQRSCSTAVFLWHLDAHQAELVQLLEQAGVELLRLVHLTDQRGDFFARKLANGVAEHLFIGGKLR